MAPGYVGDANIDNGQLVDYEQYWSTSARRIRESTLRSIVKQFSGIKDIIGMHGGVPPMEVLPLQGVAITLKDGSSVSLNSKEDLWLMQQYQMKADGQGYVLQWVKDHMKQQHNPPGGHEVTMSLGNTYSINMCLDLLLNPGDSFLCEEYTFSSVIEGMAQSKGLNAVPVTMDQFGIVPQDLDALLKGIEDNNGEIPKLLYIITCGQNPTGIRYSLNRIQGIYEVCRKYGVLIMEDDPYYYVQYPLDSTQELPGLNLGPTFLSVDEDERVIRLDTFSKFLMPGSRLGWITAHPDMVRKCTSLCQMEVLGPNSISQIMIGAILNQWGHEGFETYIKSLQQVYSRKSSVAIKACKEYLSGYVEFSQPEAGMFLWLKMLHVSSFSEINENLKREGVVLVPGRIFSPLARDPKFKCPYLRLSFTNCSEEELIEGVQRLGRVLERNLVESGRQVN